MKKTRSPSSHQNRPDRDRRVRQNARMARVLAVLNLIQSRGRWNAKTIGEELGCSERTVYRDLEVLEFAGVPWYFDDQDQCYRVRPDYRFPIFGLTEDELMGQAIATVVTKARGLDVGPGASPLTRKLAAASSEKAQQLLADAMAVVNVLDLKLADHSRHQDAIKTAQIALIRSKQLVGTYESPYEGNLVRLKLHPYARVVVQRLKDAASARSALETDIRRLKGEEEKHIRQRDKASEELSAWQVEWKDAIAPLGFPGDTRVEEATEVVASLTEMFTKISESATLKSRVENMANHVETFTADVSSLVGHGNPDAQCGCLPLTEHRSVCRERSSEATWPSPVFCHGGEGPRNTALACLRLQSGRPLLRKLSDRRYIRSR